MSHRSRKETDLYTMAYDADIGAVVFTWEEFASGDRFREGGHDLLEFIKEKNARKILVNTSGIQAHGDDDTAWLQNELVPKIIDAGVEYSAYVHRESVISEMDIEGFQEGLEEQELTTLRTDNVDEAREWLAEQ